MDSWPSLDARCDREVTRFGHFIFFGRRGALPKNRQKKNKCHFFLRYEGFIYLGPNRFFHREALSVQLKIGFEVRHGAPQAVTSLEKETMRYDRSMSVLLVPNTWKLCTSLKPRFLELLELKERTSEQNHGLSCNNIDIQQIYIYIYILQKKRNENGIFPTMWG